MARPLRIEFQDALHHVMARGKARAPIMDDDDDQQAWVDTLAKTASRFGWRVWAYCLVGNHYHLQVETPQPNLSRGMRELNGVHTQAFKRRHGRVGHLFQGRFKALLVDKDACLLELCRYVLTQDLTPGVRPCRAPVPGTLQGLAG
jgi:REP element-mobilizing transposase RayT